MKEMKRIENEKWEMGNGGGSSECERSRKIRTKSS